MDGIVDEKKEILVKKYIQEIYEQREEILKAFIAKYGFGPDEAIQIQGTTPDGKLTWRVEKQPTIIDNLQRIADVLERKYPK